MHENTWTGRQISLTSILKLGFMYFVALFASGSEFSRMRENQIITSSVVSHFYDLW